jgi:hypothetical protein
LDIPYSTFQSINDTICTRLKAISTEIEKNVLANDVANKEETIKINVEKIAKIENQKIKMQEDFEKEKAYMSEEQRQEREKLIAEKEAEKKAREDDKIKAQQEKENAINELIAVKKKEDEEKQQKELKLEKALADVDTECYADQNVFYIKGRDINVSTHKDELEKFSKKPSSEPDLYLNKGKYFVFYGIDNIKFDTNLKLYGNLVAIAPKIEMIKNISYIDLSGEKGTNGSDGSNGSWCQANSRWYPSKSCKATSEYKQKKGDEWIGHNHLANGGTDGKDGEDAIGGYPGGNIFIYSKKMINNFDLFLKSNGGDGGNGGRGGNGGSCNESYFSAPSNRAGGDGGDGGKNGLGAEGGQIKLILRNKTYEIPTIKGKDGDGGYGGYGGVGWKAASLSFNISGRDGENGKKNSDFVVKNEYSEVVLTQCQEFVDGYNEFIRDSLGEDSGFDNFML